MRYACASFFRSDHLRRMVFLRKSKSHDDSELLVPPAASACMGSAFWVRGAGGEETLAPQFAALLGVDGGDSLEDILARLPNAAAAALSRLLADLLQGRAGEASLESADGARHLTAVSHILTGGQEHGTHVIWLHDATEEQKKHHRLLQENQKLKSELKHASTLLNLAPFPIWERGSDLNIRFYNLAYGEIAEETVSRQGDVAAPPELDRRAKMLARKALESGEPKKERRHIVVGGERRFYEFSEFPLSGEGMVAGFAQEVSEVEMLQEELQRYMSAQADLLESSASAMAIYGPDMRLKSFNFAFVNLWTLEESWLETQPSYSEVLESLREKRKLPEQANFQMFKQQQLKLFTGLIESREEFFYLPDGRTLRVIAIPHALGGILFAYEDVTDRLALERSYNTLIAVQRETLDNLHEAIAVFGEDGRLKLSNPVYLNLWEMDEATAKAEPHISDIIDRSRALYIPDEEWGEFRAKRVAQIHSRAPMTSRLERTDGKVLDCATVPLPDGATLITYLDVTDSTLVERSLRERNEALTEADRLKTQFLANVSYELRSPLTSISGFSDLLSREYFGELNAKQREYVEGIHQSSQHLMQLVNDILDLASIEAGYMQLNVSEFDVPSMMKSVLALTAERAREHQLAVKLECESDVGIMLADETRLKQGLFNLLSNAVRFTPPGGHITLGAKAEEDGAWITLWVEDDGPGIPEEERPYIFDKFYKGKHRDTPRARGKSGTGLGLSMVKSFIELHGGQVRLESAAGQGTKVTCTLPRRAAEMRAGRSVEAAGVLHV